MRTITFQGHKVKYDERCLRSWKMQRAIARATSTGDPNASFEAADTILMGKADEIAELLGDDIDTMGELLQAIVNEVGGEAKN